MSYTMAWPLHPHHSPPYPMIPPLILVHLLIPYPYHGEEHIIGPVRLLKRAMLYTTTTF
ncbi:hypothetical protein E2C01_050902 [Portunus trituberculatus]|uniref:Uncharacterized protein n=1 Tax=Portunus trituberculatus TaxID=210409 RepID=A0A5B7GK74_PORTR|nr:hypothetical protein [Portunus trituberculatus]